MRYPISVIVAILVLASSFGSAQTQISPPSGTVRYDKDGKFVAASFTFRVPLQPPVLGFMPERPYSAEEISQQTQILPDGNRVVRSSYSGYFYRDSAGRTRTEQRFPQSMIMKPSEAPVVPEIFDPVAGCIYYLDQAKKIAHRVELPQPIKALVPPQGLVFPTVGPIMMNAASG
jgi:hypothetical protein